MGELERKDKERKKKEGRERKLTIFSFKLLKGSLFV